jgi:hypothetical protein
MKNLFILLFLACGQLLQAQVAVNTDGSTPDNSAMLDVKSTTKGLLAPRMTQLQRDAIVSPANGLLVFQTDNIPGYYYNNGTSSTPSWLRLGELLLPYTGTITSDNYTFSILNNGNGIGIFGKGFTGVIGYSTLADGLGVVGNSTALTGTCYGVMGISKSATGYGIYGKAPFTGIMGEATNESGAGYGIYGQSASEQGYGVYGDAKSYDGPNTGVYGVTQSQTGGIGVHGYASMNNSNSSGVMGETNANLGKGVYGKASHTSGTTYGIYGEVVSSSGYSGYFTGGKFYVNGNAGFGTLSPTCQLVIQAPDDLSRNMIQVLGGSGNNRILLRQNSNGAGSLNVYDNTNTCTTWLSGDGWNNYINVNDYNLGVGTTAPTQKLDVNGNARFRAIASDAYYGVLNRKSDGTLTTATSDISFKENIKTLQNSLDKVTQLRGVAFTWKNNPEYGTRIGFIAQEFEKVIPELVFTNDLDGYKGINYAEVTAVLTEAIKELKTENDRLGIENALLKSENSKIMDRLERIESILNLSAKK